MLTVPVDPIALYIDEIVKNDMFRASILVRKSGNTYAAVEVRTNAPFHVSRTLRRRKQCPRKTTVLW